jgi:hypothetical protein
MSDSNRVPVPVPSTVLKYFADHLSGDHLRIMVASLIGGLLDGSSTDAERDAITDYVEHTAPITGIGADVIYGSVYESREHEANLWLLHNNGLRYISWGDDTDMFEGHRVVYRITKTFPSEIAAQEFRHLLVMAWAEFRVNQFETTPEKEPGWLLSDHTYIGEPPTYTDLDINPSDGVILI